jgi:glucose 1-dehydrogenase
VRAMTVVPGQPDTADATEVPEPSESDGPVVVDGLLAGVCGTDREIAVDGYGWCPPGRDRLVLGHESVGRVREAPAGSGLASGDLVAGIVRRPDPVPCQCCAADAWDFCRNGRYTERGIKERDGYGSQRWRIEPEFAVRLDPALGRLGVLVEPASVVAKAWEQIELIGGRACWEPRRLLVAGAGPIGLLGALLGVQRGMQVHVIDRVTQGPKPRLVADLEASYHTGTVEELGLEPDVVLECTGAGSLVFDIADSMAPNAVMCLLGVGCGGKQVAADLSEINRELVLRNTVLFGSVNAARRHYQDAAEALAKADRSWLERLITRTVPLGDWAQGLYKREDDVKVVVDLEQ